MFMKYTAKGGGDTFAVVFLGALIIQIARL